MYIILSFLQQPCKVGQYIAGTRQRLEKYLLPLRALGKFMAEMAAWFTAYSLNHYITPVFRLSSIAALCNNTPRNLINSFFFQKIKAEIFKSQIPHIH